MSRRIITVTPRSGIFEGLVNLDPQLSFDFEVTTEMPEGWFGRTVVNGVGKFLSKNHYTKVEERWSA